MHCLTDIQTCASVKFLMIFYPATHLMLYSWHQSVAVWTKNETFLTELLKQQQKLTTEFYDTYSAEL